jgi:flagellar basal body-associated protein FliL
VIIIVLLVFSLFTSLLAPRTLHSANHDLNALEVSATKGSYDVDNQKHETPANHEPVFMSVFKFLVNCNPFKKETSF